MKSLKRIGTFLALGIFLLVQTNAQQLYTSYQDSEPKYIINGSDYSGICVDIISALNERIENSRMKILLRDEDNPSKPFARIQQDLGNGDIDLFVGLAKNESREKIFVFSQTPAYRVESTFAIRKGEVFNYNGPEDLEDKSIAVIHGTRTADQMMQLGLEDIYAVRSLEQALGMLMIRRVDLVYYHSIGLGYSIKTLGLTDHIEISNASFDMYDHYIAYSRSVNPQIIDIINSALNNLHKDGTISEIISRYN